MKVEIQKAVLELISKSAVESDYITGSPEASHAGAGQTFWPQAHLL